MIKLWQESLKERHPIQFFTPKSAFFPPAAHIGHIFWGELRRCKEEEKFWRERGWTQGGWNASGMIFKIPLIPNSCKITILVEIEFDTHHTISETVNFLHNIFSIQQSIFYIWHISLKLQNRGRLLYKNIAWKQIVRRNCTNSLAMFWCDGFCAMVCLILLFVSLIIDWYFWTNHCSFKAPKLVMKTVGKVQWSKR